MVLDPTNRDSDFKNSLKKYFIDNFVTSSNIFTTFDSISEVPKDGSGNEHTKWIIVAIGDKDLGTLASCYVTLHLFTRNDSEGDDLSTLVDTVLNYFISEENVSGVKIIPYYDTSGAVWSQIGGIVPLIQPLSAEYEGKENTKIRDIVLRCRWGAK